MLKIKNMMLTNVITASPKISVKEAIGDLFEKHVGSVVLVDSGQKCVGIFTERDAIRLVAEDVDLNKLLGEVMTKNVITVGLDSSIDEVRQIVQTHHVRHLPVLDDDGRLVGLLSVRDILDQFFGFTSHHC
ncbi:MAG: CBS domain-containing protein [Candidatus Bathyarchaeota archaeon]